MRPVFLRWLVLAVLMTLAGCATTPEIQPASPPQVYQQHLASLADISQFHVQGRIGVQAEGRGFSGSTQWQHDGRNDQLALFSPLGAQVATISTTADGVLLVTENGKRYIAADVETLTQQNLGWSLPMQGLPDWVLGRPAATPVQQSQWDTNGRLTRLVQDGWDITYAQYVEVESYSLPNKITLRSPKLNLKLIIERWAVNRQETAH